MTRLLIFVFWGLIYADAALTQQDENPSSVVGRFHATLLKTMQQATELGFAGRYAKLSPAVQESHDLAGIARVVVGRYWQRLGDKRQMFVAIFGQLSIATYAHQFNDYAGESFVIVSQHQPEENRAVVATQLIEADGNIVNLDYMLRPVNGRWRIINVTYDGISDLALKRSEYTSIIRQQGIQAFMVKLQEKIAQYRKSPG